MHGRHARQRITCAHALAVAQGRRRCLAEALVVDTCWSRCNSAGSWPTARWFPTLLPVAIPKSNGSGCNSSAACNTSAVNGSLSSSCVMLSLKPATGGGDFVVLGSDQDKFVDSGQDKFVGSDQDRFDQDRFDQDKFVRFCSKHRPPPLQASIFSSGVGTFCRAPVLHASHPRTLCVPQCAFICMYICLCVPRYALRLVQAQRRHVFTREAMWSE
jgi:hypothetical protein